MNGSTATWHTPPVPDSNPYRELPSVDDLAASLESRLPMPLVVEVARASIEQARAQISEGADGEPDKIAVEAIARLERDSGVPVVNATGVLLHTNLGRARWSKRAIEQAGIAARHNTNVEIDLESGARSRRGQYVTSLLQTLTGAEDALVVNNNASALLLSVAATASGLAVPVSRGEMIEIGGSYRLPEVIEAAGARLVEVGTTNRTRIGDYQTAVQANRCGSILKIHPSNYRIEGFTATVSTAELVQLTSSIGLPLIHDVGSGLLDANTPWLRQPTPDWLREEPAVRQELEAGANLVTFSGDKLLGGPQAGVIVGDRETVERLRNHPLARALRVDGPTLAALAATLEAFLSGDVSEIPFWREATLSAESLAGRAKAVANRRRRPRGRRRLNGGSRKCPGHVDPVARCGPRQRRCLVPTPASAAFADSHPTR